MRKRSFGLLLMLGLLASVTACNHSEDSTDSTVRTSTTGEPTQVDGRRLIQIANDANATVNMVIAAGQARPGDTIQFDCGYYELGTGMVFQTTEDVIVEGCGMNETVLSFKGSDTAEGILAINVRGLIVRNLTVLDTPGDGVKLKGVDHGTLDHVRAMWSSGGGANSATPVTAENYAQALQVECTDPPFDDPRRPENQGNPFADTTSVDYTPSNETGRYGIYPVASRNILVTDSESIGASDAGIYVGQTTNAIIRNSRAAYNVMGLEIENVQGGEYDSNIAECNTGGFLIYDLDGLDQYGYASRMFNNIARMNNTYNFNSGGFVGNVPPGSGMITLSYDRIEIFNNEFRDNNTGGIIWASYALFPEGDRPSETQIDFYTEGVHIHDNVFINNGNNLPNPNFEAIVASGGGDVNTALPFLVGIKSALGVSAGSGSSEPSSLAELMANGGYRGAHIVWDGLLDSYDADCPYPVDQQGNPVPQATYAPGKPEYRNEHGNPACRYNAYKFDTAAEGAPRIEPDWLGCIEANNEFAADSVHFTNFHGLEGLELILSQDPSALDPATMQNLAASHDDSAFDCDTRFGQNLPALAPVVIPPFERSGQVAPAPSDARVAELCNADLGQNVNFAAALEVNCPSLQNYNLFADPQDPTSRPLSNGVPFVLNTKLFSDYSLKYRVAFMPPETQAQYRDNSDFGPNAGIVYPVGTILAKTFTFADETTASENPAETRLLIKRANPDGSVYWSGMAYVWTTENGRKLARLAEAGATLSAAWNYTDPATGQNYTGSTDAYSVPHVNQCVTCHGNDDKEVGAAPIGPKARHLNRPYRAESPIEHEQSRHASLGVNQLQFLCDSNLLTECPSLEIDPTTQIATNIERVPAFNVPGDAGFEAGSDQDIEARSRAYLEINCQHCHNPKGAASNTGVYFDVFRAVDTNYGICKGPTAAGGEGSGGREHDIHPGDASNSIIPFRIGPDATSAAARMPPLARSTVHTEAVTLIEQWIDAVVTADETRYPGSTSCASGDGGNSGGDGTPMCAPDEIPGIGGQCLPADGGDGGGEIPMCAPNEVPGVGGECLPL